ncbi:MAG: family 10 glycosylhydrolase [Oscillospiraceae bacterium]
MPPKKTQIYILIIVAVLIFISAGIILIVEKNKAVSADSDVKTTASDATKDQTSSESQTQTTQQGSESTSGVLQPTGSTSSTKKPVSTKPHAQKPVKPNPPAPKPNPNPKPLPPSPPSVSHENIKGVWISYLEIAGYKNLGQSQFTTKMENCLNYAKSRGLNTVIVQVRSHGDAIYPSAYYPWSKYITTSGSLSYDPLSIIVSLAHSKGISVHAWINPFRVMTDSEFQKIPSSYPTKQWYSSSSRDSYMIQKDSRWYLKPGNAEVRELIFNGVGELVSKYDIDAIHIDDYFYATSPSNYGDSSAQAKQNNTALVRGIYQKVKSIKPKVLFGISPAGSFKAGSVLPTSDTGYLSTNLKLWCNNAGYIDYVMPQIYWKHGHSTQDFTRVLGQWRSFVKSPSVALYTGLAVYKESSSETSDPFPKGEIASQINEIQSSGMSSGYCLFRYDFINQVSF